MSERKVLNKYYPPDFDPSKIPRLKQPKTRQYTIRTMAPFNMRCNTCGNYIYKGRKFNAKCETAEGENFLGLRIYRFYIRCPTCISEIMFKTDPENTDYTLEHGAKRLFEAQKLLEEQEKKQQEQLDEDSTNPMKMLENRTKDSKLEMDIMENLEELRELNTRQKELDYTEILKRKAEEAETQLLRQEEEDEAEIRRIFGKNSEKIIKRLDDDSASDSEETERSCSSSERSSKRASDFLVEEASVPKKQKTSKSSIAGLVRVKKSNIKRIDEEITDHAKQNQKSINDANTATNSKQETKQTNDVRLVAYSAEENKASSDEVTLPEKKDEKLQPEVPEMEFDEVTFENSIMEGMARTLSSSKKKETVKAAGFGLLVGYDDSDSSDTSD